MHGLQFEGRISIYNETGSMLAPFEIGVRIAVPALDLVSPVDSMPIQESIADREQLTCSVTSMSVFPDLPAGAQVQVEIGVSRLVGRENLRAVAAARLLRPSWLRPWARFGHKWGTTAFVFDTGVGSAGVYAVVHGKVNAYRGGSFASAAAPGQIEAVRRLMPGAEKAMMADFETGGR